MANFKVEKVNGEWSVIEKASNAVVETTTSRDKAREAKKVWEDNNPKIVTEKTAVQATEEVHAEVAPPKKKKTPRAEIVHETITNDQKVSVITQENYQANLNRARELKELLARSYREDGGFPSHRYIQRELGFQISIKAIIRHKKNVITKILGLEEDTVVPTVTQLPGPTKKPSKD